jgi:hypothetical protein
MHISSGMSTDKCRVARKMKRPHYSFVVNLSSRSQQFPHAPDVIADSSSHCGRHPERLMATAEVVKGKPQHECCAVILKLFAEAVGQTGKAADAHSHREILALNMAGTNASRIGLADAWVRDTDLAHYRAAW